MGDYNIRNRHFDLSGSFKLGVITNKVKEFIDEFYSENKGKS